MESHNNGNSDGSSMKSGVLLVLGLIIFCPAGFSQGSWNMKYLPLDSLNESFIGKELRIDFKSKGGDKTKHPERNIRKIFSKCDTATLDLADRSLRFTESWKIHVDHGVLYDQTLQSVDGIDERLIIREMFVRAISTSSITLEIYTYRPGSKEKLSVQEINVDKSLINGIIVGTGTVTETNLHSK